MPSGDKNDCTDESPLSFTSSRQTTRLPVSFLPVVIRGASFTFHSLSWWKFCHCDSSCMIPLRLLRTSELVSSVTSFEGSNLASRFCTNCTRRGCLNCFPRLLPFNTLRIVLRVSIHSQLLTKSTVSAPSGNAETDGEWRWGEF